MLKNISYILVSIMIIGYWGLYVKTLSKESKVSFKQYRWLIIFGGLYSCFIGWATKWIHFSNFAGMLTGTVLFGDTATQDNTRLTGCFYNPNFNMYLLLLSLAFLLAETLIAIRKKQSLSIIWHLPILFILSFGIFDTGSRSGFAVMCLLYMLFLIRLNKTAFMMIAIVSLLQFKRLFNLMPRSALVDHSMNNRKQIWEFSFKLWKLHPVFGTTPLGFQQEFTKLLQLTYKKIPHSLSDIPHSHDMYLGAITEYGIVGGVPFFLLLIVNFYKYLLLFIRKIKPLDEYFMFALPVCILTGIFDEPLFSPQIALISIFLFSFWRSYTDKKSIIRFKIQNQLNGSGKYLKKAI
ncbi:O-antigen ligase family protein [Heyndrickxia acidicola]|uniref:O-antigen ligase family protein n=1 Tax=Heyndrickxia acidicola TaxID=209389 RepID=A0ABU6MDE7_9BACI|nr:O-antigen ligase family protein [Heyndrickxia acidicola]MED1202684.1 O-antigen ligase family protein [Heyndrickxia acidicola]